MTLNVMSAAPQEPTKPAAVSAAAQAQEEAAAVEDGKAEEEEREELELKHMKERLNAL